MCVAAPGRIVALDGDTARAKDLIDLFREIEEAAGGGSR